MTLSMGEGKERGIHGGCSERNNLCVMSLARYMAGRVDSTSRRSAEQAILSLGSP